MRRVLLTLAALSIPISAVTITFGSTAWAKPVTHGTEASIVCSALTGTFSGTMTASPCTGNTGGATMPTPVSVLESGGVMTWANGDTTTLGAPALSLLPPSKKCADKTGQVLKFVSPIVADTTGLKKWKKATGVVCDSGGNLSLVKAIKVT